MDTKIFARNLKAILESKQIKNIDLSRSAGVSRSYITQILKGEKNNISSEVLNKLAGALDILPRDIIKLFDVTIDPIALSSKKPSSILIPFLFKFSALTSSIIEDLFSTDFSRNYPSSLNFISFPRCEPFQVMEGRKIISINIDLNTGMCPIISINDIVFIDLLDLSTTEGQIYLCKTKHSLKFRYAIQDEFKGGSIIHVWAEERKYPIEIFDLQEFPESPILGKVITVTHRFGI